MKANSKRKVFGDAVDLLMVDRGALYTKVDLRSEINAAIESMENPEERLLLKYRYLKNESWEDISYELNVSYRTVHRIHASALNNFIVPE